MPYEWSEPTDPVEQEALALARQGGQAWQQKQFAAAREFLEKSLSLSLQVQYTLGIIGAQHLLANVAFDEGDVAQARTLHEEVLAECRRIDWPGAIASTLNGLGVVAEREGKYDEACMHLEESIRILEQIGSTELAEQVRKNLDRVRRLRGKETA